LNAYKITNTIYINLKTLYRFSIHSRIMNSERISESHNQNQKIVTGKNPCRISVVLTHTYKRMFTLLTNQNHSRQLYMFSQKYTDTRKLHSILRMKSLSKTGTGARTKKTRFCRYLIRVYQDVERFTKVHQGLSTSAKVYQGLTRSTKI